MTELMNKKNAILRAVIFIFVYLLFYAVPILALRTVPISVMRKLPTLVGNLCFFLPQVTFPFNEISWHGDSPFIFNQSTSIFISILYLIFLAISFSKMTSFARKLRWIIPLSFCFSAVAIVLLNLIFWICGIAVELDGP
ncbi:MAG TPA: hypothetical protein VK840_03940 [Candidatus Dormibacteraeota bacterium]|nr:hypothetical protein [Candidatus Dormibacteraeota bacterium]